MQQALNFNAAFGSQGAFGATTHQGVTATIGSVIEPLRAVTGHKKAAAARRLRRLKNERKLGEYSYVWTKNLLGMPAQQFGNQRVSCHIELIQR